MRSACECDEECVLLLTKGVQRNSGLTLKLYKCKACAQIFCELRYELNPESEDDDVYVRLTLNQALTLLQIGSI